MRAIHHWIDGKLTPGTSGRTADVYNPATGEVQAKVDLATRAKSTPRSPARPKRR